MAEKKKTEWTDFMLGIFSPNYLFIQCAMFVIHYGFKMNLPNWVMWFPTWIYGGFIALVLVILLLVLIVTSIIS